MFLFDLLGAALTLLTLAFLALGGFLLALILLRETAARDRLALAIAALLAACAEAVAIALLLGALGLLRLELALLLQALLVLLLLRAARRLPGQASTCQPPQCGSALPQLRRLGAGSEAGIRTPARQLLACTAGRVREHPALSLVALHAVGSEALRGLLRPPLSWDSLMYHLLLAATWLQQHDLRPVLGIAPINHYGFVPANGSLWLWWWMAPSHSELYVNLAFLPQLTLLGLAAGGLARQLGARRHWPLASFLTVLTPTVVRFAATEYVDIFVAAALCAGCFFGLLWLREPRWPPALLAGAGLGLACGTKILGLPYAAVMAAALLAAAPGRWRPRLPQAAAALLVAAALGGYFYARNVVWGAGPLALVCEEQTRKLPHHLMPVLPRPDSVAALWATVGKAQLLDAFFGITRPQSMELGVGPPVLVLLAVLLVLPFAGDPRRRCEAWVAASQAGFELAFWLIVPFSANLHIFANVRYLIPAFALTFAGGVAIAEHRAMSDLWLRGIALALAVQSLLQLHSEMPHGVRLTMALADLGAVAFGLSPALRGLARRRAAALAAAALALALAGAPLLARFRVADRPRALAAEWTAHSTSARIFAAGWGWLDRNGGGGAVAVVSAPTTYFVYPAMGPYLERRAVYVNVNRANLDNAARYPGCNPRVEPSPAAWIDNLRRAGIRWLLLGRYPEFEFPGERQWAEARPDLFTIRFADPTNLVFELHPAPTRFSQLYLTINGTQ
ncbi:MAG TPA: hypothetical protein VHR45_03130 [Thermoanaerobaculia bacterium]|nr:hypothetical protein [Thermoanaerobaculia bacterium]